MFVRFNGRTYYKNERGYYLTARYHGPQRRLHRDVWEFHNGSIPEGHDIHHKDENKDNNAIENLELILHASHSKLHSNTSSNVEAKFYSPDLEGVCKYCSEKFMYNSAYPRKYCSAKCSAKQFRLEKKDHILETCIVCGNIFAKRKDKATLTCSNECRIAKIKQTKNLKIKMLPS